MIVTDLVVLSKLPQRYTYIVPEDLDIKIGDYVDITFAKRQHVGLCVSLKQASEDDYSYTLSTILSIHEKRASVPVFLIELMEWFAHFYCVTEYQALQCIVGLKKLRLNAFKELSNSNELASLSGSQQLIFDSIIHNYLRNHLLHGVTGSGKTQIYAHLIQNCILQSRQAILLIPEISLTPQFTSFFSAHFKRFAVVHSGLTPKKKEEIWNQCLRGELDLIVGPRSAIFMPFKQLGLIIVDEEHDASYKQESTPRYYTHDVAFKRALIHQACLVFGSATPSVQLYYLAQQKQLLYHHLTERFNVSKMPHVSILDMNQTRTNFLIHDDLLESIELTLRKKQRILILVNRRGYSSFLKCSACGAIQECKSCQTSYTYHSDGYFRCHRCMSTKRMSRQCSDCGSYDVEYHGIAIQKIEMEIIRLFPDAKLTRIDRDTVKNMTDLESALDDVESSDILIGTQMISKGHNFKNVALVGIIGVDTLLNFPDYRSNERLFQLITQMAGRAGRDLVASHVYVQTFKPGHYVFEYALDHNVSDFLKTEIDFRQLFNYPPFRSVVNVIFSSKYNSTAVGLYKDISVFNNELKKRLPNIQIIGPKVAPIEKVSGYFRHNVFYKVSHDDLERFKSFLLKFPSHRHARLVLDIAPQSLL